MISEPLLKTTDFGLYCERGDFFIDPWRPVERAVVTHAHADHLCRGCSQYLIARDGLSITRARLDEHAAISTVSYGEPVEINGVQVTLHPAGHILGSAQVRLEQGGRVWVISGDYKVEHDRTCVPFEPIGCHTFVSECTFGLPIYQWPAQQTVFADIIAWWQGNQAEDRASILYAYALGKAQRVLAGLAATTLQAGNLPGRIYTHGAVEVMNQAYREAGVDIPATTHVAEVVPPVNWATALVIAPPSAHGTPWMRRFGPASTGLVSGWMRLRGTRRRRAIDRGFVLSDHADWLGLLAAVNATAAETIWLTHGYTAVVARWLRDQGKDAHALATRYEGERDDPIAADEISAGETRASTTSEPT